jgi:hypothetical protein
MRYIMVSCKTWNLESGILESWNPGILESWNPGILSYNRRICYYQDIIIILIQHIVLFHINLTLQSSNEKFVGSSGI